MYDKSRIAYWRMYVVTDERLSMGRSHCDIARQAIQGGADAIQLRDKSATSGELLDSAHRIRAMTEEAGVCFIVDDRLDLALAAGADGLHIGRDDEPIEEVKKRLSPDKIIGVSALSVEQAVAAESAGADYIGIGPVFEARGSKPDAGQPLGLELIRAVRTEVSLPIVAIGGIAEENIASVIRAGANCAAVISAVVCKRDMADATSRLVELLVKSDNI